MKNSETKPLIRLYGITPYDRSAKVRWLLTELKLDFENRWLSRDKKEYESPAFLELNPMGRIPVLEMDDRAIFESGAICAYLGDRFQEKGLVPSLSSPERTEYQQWMYFAASTLDPFQTRIMIIEDIPASDLRTEKETALLNDVQDAMSTLNQLLTKRTYLVGDRFSVADICVGYHLYWSTLWPEFDAIIRSFPGVTSYLERLKKMPSAIEAKVFSYEA